MRGRGPSGVWRLGWGEQLRGRGPSVRQGRAVEVLVPLMLVPLMLHSLIGDWIDMERGLHLPPTRAGQGNNPGVSEGGVHHAMAGPPTHEDAI